MIRHGLLILLTCLVAAGWGYWLLAWACARRLLRAGRAREEALFEAGKLASFAPSVSLLKPVKGIDAEAYANFVTFCDQDYAGTFEVLFAVADAHDPVVTLVTQLARAFPRRVIRCITAPPLGANPKSASLHALSREATGDVLVISDGDIRVPRDYLTRVVAPLADPRFGLVTCPYQSVAPIGLPARLEALHMDAVFLPAVALAHRLGQRVGMGATLALRKADLLRAGGFAAIADHLMDDYQLAALIERLSLRTHLSACVVASVLGRTRFKTQWSREVRWSRGIRATEPAKYWGLLFTCPTPWAILLLAISRYQISAALVLLATLLMRWLVAWDLAGPLGRSSRANLPLLPLRDVLSLATWCAGLFGRRIEWRGQAFILDASGRLSPSVPRRSGGPLETVVRWLDALLRRREGIFEFCDHPDCIARVSIGTCEEAVELSDGARLAPGDLVCDVHFWNERLPRIPSGGSTLAWASRLQQLGRTSLVQLARAMEFDPRLQRCKALRGRTTFVPRDAQRLQRMADRLHFELNDPPPSRPSLLRRLHNRGEDVLVWALVRTFNPGGLRGAAFRRERHRFFMSRRALTMHYGATGAVGSTTQDLGNVEAHGHRR